MVKLIQLLCPARHCLCATAYEPERSNFKEACARLDAAYAGLGFARFCALCGSHELHYEESDLPFKTLAEATPTLVAQQAANMQTRQILEDAGMTYPKIRDN